jgi:hypothetical protein
VGASLRRRSSLAVCLGLAGTVLATSGGAALWLLRDPSTHFLARRSQLVAVREGPEQRSHGHVSRSVELRAASGLLAELLVRHPEPAQASATDGIAQKRPLFLILGGYRTGQRTAALLDDTRGSVVAALAYPYRGPTDIKGTAVLRHVPAIRSALLDTPPALQLALDYLTGRPDVDGHRVELVGVSFGASFAAIAAALDPRVTRLWLVHGAGRPFTLIEHNLAATFSSPVLRAPAAALLNLLVSGPRLAPEVWVPRLAPRPLIMINALGDERLPRAAVEALYAAASHPKEQIWLPGPHVQTNRTDVVESLVDAVITRAAGP